jgi:hypothetical protein
MSNEIKTINVPKTVAKILINHAIQRRDNPLKENFKNSNTP